MRAKECIQKINALATVDHIDPSHVAQARTIVGDYHDTKKDARWPRKQEALLAGATAQGPRCRRLMTCGLVPHASVPVVATALRQHIADAAKAAQRGDWQGVILELEVVNQVDGANPCLAQVHKAIVKREAGDLAGAYATLAEAFESHEETQRTTQPDGETTELLTDAEAADLLNHVSQAALAEDLPQLTQDPSAISTLFPSSFYNGMWPILVTSSAKLKPSMLTALLTRESTLVPVRDWLIGKSSQWLTEAALDLKEGRWEEAQARLSNYHLVHSGPDCGTWVQTFTEALRGRAANVVTCYTQLSRLLAESTPLTPEEREFTKTITQECLRQDLQDNRSVSKLAKALPVLVPDTTTPFAALLVQEARDASCTRLLEARAWSKAQRVEWAAPHSDNPWAQAQALGWDIATATCVQERWLLLCQPIAQVASPEYQLVTTPLSRHLDKFSQLAANQDILGVSLDPNPPTLHLLVRANSERQGGYALIRDSNLAAALAQIEASGGEVCGYAQSIYNGHLTLQGQREHLLVAKFGQSARYDHCAMRALPPALPTAIAQQESMGWRVCGVAADNPLAATRKDLSLTLVFKRVRSGPIEPTLDILQRIPTGSSRGSILTTLENLPTHLPNRQPWKREATRLAEWMGALATTPWESCYQLAALAHRAHSAQSDSERVFAADVFGVVTHHLADMLAHHPIEALCERISTYPNPESQVYDALALCIAQATFPPALRHHPIPITGTPRSAALGVVVNNQSAAAASLLIALGADPDAPLAADNPTTAREAAMRSGNPALCDALDGNVLAAREWGA